MRRHLLAAGLVLVASAPARAGEHVRLDRDVVPLRQAVSLRLDPRGDAYTGSVRIELDVRRPSRRVRLHAQEMTIRSATIDGVAAAQAPGPDDTLDVGELDGDDVGRPLVLLDVEEAVQDGAREPALPYPEGDPGLEAGRGVRPGHERRRAGRELDGAAG